MSAKKIPHRLYLTEDQMPRQWYNLRADMPEQPDPLLNPGTLRPLAVEELYPIFCEALARQEMDGSKRYYDIPEEVQEVYKMYRPSPLIRAFNLEKALGTPAKIYYKFEGNNTSGSHKLNSAVAQAYYAKAQGITRLTTETGAGQWGTALSEACSYFGIDLDVFMVKCSYEQKPFRKAVMGVFDANVTPSPSPTTEVGRKILAENPGTTGSLGCAISEAVESAVTAGNSRYVLGSVLNQVLLHQSIIGLESKAAMEELGEYPDVVVGCAGGGSNLGGLIAPFMQDKLTGKHDPRIVAVEPASCPSLTRGKYAYDFCDTGKVTPMARMYTLGSGFIPSANHAGGLRYHGMSPILSKLYHDKFMEAVSYRQTEVFEAAVLFAKLETILPAPESAHAIKGAIDEAMKCRESGEEKTILFGLTGTGYFDMTAYEAYLSGTMSDHVPTDEELQKGFDTLPDIPQNKGI
ncbi:TrpB-like pyridoxal phosphate-dependent enzyme [Lawsonibacter faecis]|uniref:Tryptophan synthase beta chain n=1 Tax=Lawsonibacter faecis TaxID=2763052 RepID=A0A8J6MGQ2_9FIRM|nr:MULTISPECIES: TrpB-like pyridoxal phosphate-dependent enzyme [Oscillospiraceae]MTQ95341.1 TrpB-like pyridoxal phosphate-dependent enzyme [Pseudoflavonifractor sp. BIOML-A16]MTR07084.1 TrpB-like pyridoxal phosphate-dependent enzyme [Pseudoflavonifractor sp. BIOML-A15]MTR72705.1 TrpB-like pyridoxal phosphate-dependent enzyme [Pseudoflavonifractor sp. BIOML-A18]MTS64397.1 TrpB-like pyridoxal phosphate-dependent enzyme [Pseudoflavonifractor sp. BIOML-A5]MTS70099.1 TrpB-like pyridoxal phosphate-